MPKFEEFIKSYEPKPMEEYTDDEVDFFYNWLNLANWDGFHFNKNKKGQWVIKDPDDQYQFPSMDDAKKELHSYRNEDPDFDEDFLEYRKNKRVKNKI